jgi:prophage regulatory protein
MVDKIIREPERRSLTGLSRTAAWDAEHRGEFPKRVELVGGRIGWRLSEIQQWIETRQPADESR